MAPLIRLFGRLELEQTDDTLPAASKPRRLFALLALNAGKRVPNATIMRELWGGDLPKTPVTALHVYVSSLRKMTPSFLIKTEPHAYRLAIEPDAVDVHRFTADVDKAGKAFNDDQFTGVCDVLDKAFLLVRGAMLEGDELGPELSRQAARIADYRDRALMYRSEAAIRLGHAHEAVDALYAAWHLNPLREDIAKLLMVALCQGLRRDNAFEVYQQTVKALWEELGVEPSAVLQALYRRALSGEDVDLSSLSSNIDS